MKYTYFVEEKSTGKFKFFRSITSIVNYFVRLSSKSTTIGNRFRELEKQKQPTKINEWGFRLFRTKKI